VEKSAADGGRQGESFRAKSGPKCRAGFRARIPGRSDTVRFSRFPGFGNAFPETQNGPQTRMVKPFSRFPGFPGLKTGGSRKNMLEFMPLSP
jgi:hypothetical protein